MRDEKCNTNMSLVCIQANKYIRLLRDAEDYRKKITEKYNLNQMLEFNNIIKECGIPTPFVNL